MNDLVLDDNEYGEGLSPASRTGADNEEEEEEAGLIFVPSHAMKDYVVVAGVEDANLDPNGQDDIATEPPEPFANSNWQTVYLHATLLPDDQFSFCHVRIVDGAFSVKLLKFLTITLAGIVSMYHVVRWMEWENDAKYTLTDMFTYELNLIVMDAVMFFVVGRLHQQRGVDHAAWILSSLAANFYSSYITSFQFLQYATTLYEMHCTWPWKTWAFGIVAVPVVVAVLVLHVRHAVQKRVLVVKLTEIMLCFFLLMGPLLTSPYFHLHHWYAGLFFGMHFNFDVWWSRAVMAWCWGAYMNGIAVYGRDPVLTCGYAYFLSISQHCPYVSCYLVALAHPTYHNDTHNHTVVDVKPMVTPDWRNCSADAYHP
jgi:hypothetical protein